MEGRPGAAGAPGLDAVYRRSASVATRVIADETLVVPFRGTLASLRQIFTLNSVAVFVWERLDGVTPLAAILDAMLEHFEVGRDQAEPDLLELVADLCRIGLVEAIPPAPDSPPHP